MSKMMLLARTRFLFLLVVVGLHAVQGPSCLAQDSTVVTVDESPTAHLLIQRVLDQSEDNVGEAARLCTELIEGYGPRLVPMNEVDEDLFTTVQRRVEGILLSRPELLERYIELQEPLASRLLGQGLDREVMQRAKLTPSGLQASLAVAQLELESGDVSLARTRLEGLSDHPSLTSDSEAHRLYMLALAAHLEGDEEGHELHAGELKDLDGEEGLLERLERMRVGIAPLRLQAVSTLDSHHPPAPQGRGWHSVWSGTLDTSLYARSQSLRMDDSNALSRLRESERQSASRLTSVPLVDEDVVYIHDGDVVRAFDRYGADVGWETSIENGRELRSGIVVDLCELAISGDALIALNGHAFSTGRSSSSEVVRLDASDGSEVWRTLIDGMEIEEGSDARVQEEQVLEMNLAGAFPFGGAVIEAGNAIVQARKVNTRREMVHYLIALDLETGEPDWIRMIGSSGGVRTSRGFSRMARHRGSIIIQSEVGVIARVDPQTGDPYWVRRFRVPLSVPSLGLPPWEIGQAAVSGDSIFAITPDGSGIIQLAFETGEEIGRWPTGPGEPWGEPRYLISDDHAPAGDTIYAVGEDVIAISANSPDTVLWSFSDAAQDEIGSREGSLSRNGIRGRVHVAGERMLVPGIEDLLVLDSANGNVLESIQSPGASNPVLVDSQIILAGLDRVDSIMQLGPAEELLRARIAENPSDPARTLGLLELGIQASRPDLGIEAAEAAVVAMDGEKADGRMRETLVSMLLRLKDESIPDSPAVAVRAIELAALVARTPEQRTAVMLARGDLHARSEEHREAVRTWSSLLADQKLASQLVQVPGGFKRPNLVIRSLMEADLRSENGGRLAASWEEEASRALAGIDADRIEQLESVARAYYASPAARDAWRMVVASHAADGARDSAVQAMFESTEAFPGDVESRMDAVRLLQRSGRTRDASRLLENALQDARARDRVSSILEDETLDLVPVRQPPRLGLHGGDAVEYSGRLLGTSLLDDTRWNPGIPTLVLSVIDRTLECRHDPGSKEPDWRANLLDRTPRILEVHEDSVLVWSRPQMDNPFALSYGLADGEVNWQTPSVNDFMPTTAPQLRGSGREGLMPNGGVFYPFAIEPLLSGDSLVMIRRSGDIASLAMTPDEAPARVEWTKSGVLDRVYELAANDRFIVMAGATREVDQSGVMREMPSIVLIDSRTGEVLGESSTFTGESVRWIEIAPQGVLLVGTRSAIEALPMTRDFSPLWVSDGESMTGTIEAVVLGNKIAAARSGGDLVGLNLTDGSIVPGGFALPDSTEWSASGLVAMQPDDTGLTVLFDQQIVRFDTDGAIMGVDAIGGDRAFIDHVRTNAHDLVVDERPRDPNTGSYRYWIHRFLRAGGCRLDAQSLELNLTGRRLDNLEVREGWLLLSAGSTILAVPMSTDGDNSKDSAEGDA